MLVSVRATLSRPSGEALADQAFTARVPAAADRVGAIVEAYDRATVQVLDQIAAWTEAQAAATPPVSDAVTTTTTETRSSDRR